MNPAIRVTKAVPPSVAFVSTYPPERCGIATYTAALAPAVSNALAGTAGQSAQSAAGVTILAEHGAAMTTGDGVRSVPCFHRATYVEPLIRAIAERQPEVVHIQYTPEIFGTDERVVALARKIRASGALCVMTLHTVHTRLSGLLDRRTGIAAFHRALGEAVHAFVVHDESTMAKELRRQGVNPDKIWVIPHGTRLRPSVERLESRRALGVADTSAGHRLLLYFGFIHPQKGLHTALRALHQVWQLGRRVKLLVAGSVQNPSWYNRAYLEMCHAFARRRQLDDAVIWRLGFAPEDEVGLLYGAADAVLLPYAQSYGSASGILHHALGAGRAVLCSSSPKFAEVAEHIGRDAVLPTHSARAWARALERAATDEGWLRSLETRARRRGEQTAWPAVGAQHVALYRTLARTREVMGS
jgi:glycosyltransferase involved in cell wall biosynthesis